MIKNISRLTLNVTPQRVWDVITQPEFVKLWQFGSDLQTTWEIDSPIKFSTEWNGTIFEQWGKVLAYRSNELLTYTLFAPREGIVDSPENYFTMNYILTSNGAQTILEIVQEDPRPFAVQEPEQGEENPILKQLKDLIENDQQ
ncbi:MAG: SRPBCC domain-containing protein [Bacteroidetes bacterium]|nr:SRPBCC domain-containing protein [Bacteroidota bacterium]